MNFTDEFLKEQIEALESEQWTLAFDNQNKAAYFKNKHGKKLDLKAYGVLMEYLENYLYDEDEKQFGKKRDEPFDEFTKKRLNITDYELIDQHHKYILEVYGDDNGIYTLHRFEKYQNRVKNDFIGYFNVFELEQIITSMSNFVERHKK